MKKITEEMGVHKDWMERAKKVKSSGELKTFVEELESYGHDYGTICHAVAAAAIAGASSMSSGITGFQAGCVMWEIIKGWGVWGKGPLQMVQWGNLLYPQYDNSMPTVIGRETFDRVVEIAQAEVKAFGEPHHQANSKVLKRICSLAKGTPPGWLTVEEGR